VERRKSKKRRKEEGERGKRFLLALRYEDPSDGSSVPGWARRGERGGGVKKEKEKGRKALRPRFHSNLMLCGCFTDHRDVWTKGTGEEIDEEKTKMRSNSIYYAYITLNLTITCQCCRKTQHAQIRMDRGGRGRKEESKGVIDSFTLTPFGRSHTPQSMPSSASEAGRQLGGEGKRKGGGKERTLNSIFVS